MFVYVCVCGFVLGTGLVCAGCLFGNGEEERTVPVGLGSIVELQGVNAAAAVRAGEDDVGVDAEFCADSIVSC